MSLRSWFALLVTSGVSIGVFDEVSKEYGLSVMSLPQRQQQSAK